MSANLGAIAKFAVVGSWTSGDFRPSLVRILPDDITGRCIIADESVFVSSSSAANVRTTHTSALGPDQLRVVTALSDLTVFIAHGVTCLSGKIVTLAFVIPELYGPHKSLNRSWIPIPEEDVLADWVLFEIPEWIRFVP